MKRILTAALLLAATTWVSCTPDKKTEETEIAEDAAKAEEEEGAVTDTTLTEEKKELIQMLAQHNMLQVELGRLAAEKGATDDVKQQGQQMVQMHTDKQKELQELAKGYNLTLNTTLEDKHRKEIDDLRKQKAAEFDKKYWKVMIDDQKETLDEYEDVLNNVGATDPTAFGIWIRKTEKELRAQYEQVLAQQQQLKNRM